MESRTETTPAETRPAAPLLITKVEAAKSQLETAVRLYFEERDPISIHTLTCAAYDVLNDIGRLRGMEPIFKGLRFLNPRQRIRFIDILNRPRNFFKHGDLDPYDKLKFDPEVTTFILFDACEFYIQFTKEVPRALDVFRTYFRVRFPEFTLDPEQRRDIEELRENPDLQSRAGWLPFLTTLSVH